MPHVQPFTASLAARRNAVFLPWARLTSVTSHGRVDQKGKNLIGRELDIPMDMAIGQHPF